MLSHKENIPRHHPGRTAVTIQGRTLPPAAACVLMLVLLCPVILLGRSGHAAGQPAPGQPSITVTTDKPVYQQGEEASFNISVDPAGQQLSGDLQMIVYPAAELTSETAFSSEPLSVTEVRADVDLNIAENIGFTAKIEEDLEAGAGGFPVRVSLISEASEIVTGSTWLAVASPGAAAPLELVLLWTVGEEPQRGPDGVFSGAALAERCRVEPRTPDSLIQHLELANKYPDVKTSYAIEGHMLDELNDMADGFDGLDQGQRRGFAQSSDEAEAAAACLEGFEKLAAADNAELIGSPYTFASLPILAREGWDDGNGQYRVGRDAVAAALELEETPSGAYVSGMELTTDSLRYVAATGGEFAVLAGWVKDFVQGMSDPGLPTFRLRDLSGERITSLFANDGASASLFAEEPDINAFFAALANAHLDPLGSRLVVAASFVSNPAMTAEQRDALYAEIASQPWIDSILLTGAEATYPPGTEPVTLQRYVDPLEGYVSEAYFRRLADVHRRFEGYRLAVDTDEPELARLVKNMYVAESEYFLSEQASPENANRGLAYLDWVSDFIGEELEGLTVSVATPWMQRSAAGEALVTIDNDKLYPFNVELTLEGEGVGFPEGRSRKMRLETGSTELRIPYSSDEWSDLKVALSSADYQLAADSGGVRPVTTRVWIVAAVFALALAGGLIYILAVIRRR